MQNKINTIIVFIFITFCGYAQNQPSEKKWHFNYYPPHAPTSLIYQKEFLFQFGQRLTLRKSKTFEMFSLTVNAQFQIQKVLYISPALFLSYEKPINKKIGLITVLEFSNRKILGITSNMLTPEIGLKFDSAISINYGYNLFLDNRFSNTSKHRIAVRLMLP